MSARKIEQDPPHIAAARAKLMDEVCTALPPGAAYRQTPMTDTPGTLEKRLPCDVLVQPATLIERGCKIETLLECIELRRERSEKGPPLKDILSKRQADEIASLRARVEAAEAENERLTKAVGSGILGELLNDEETDEFVNFIKFLRSQALKPTPTRLTR